MILTKEDAFYATNVFTEFFSNFDRIDDYMRQIKMERMKTFPTGLLGMGPEDDLFDDFDMHPNDMEFVIGDCPQDQFMTYMEIVTSAPVESSIPGKQMLKIVKEKNSGKIFGMIRFGSPTINSRPRNEWLGNPLDSHNPAVMKRFNDSVIMGFNVIPVQPAAFNTLGGKLLAGICCSHQMRKEINKRYGSNIAMFETTSLYGSSTSFSSKHLRPPETKSNLVSRLLH